MTTLYTNGLIYTMDSQVPRATAIAVEQGNILAVGSTDELRLQLGRAGVKEIDLGGATVIPGLIDNHLHVSNHGIKLSTLDFSNVTSAAEMLRLVREHAAQTPDGEWVLGIGWSDNNFADRHIPTLEQLNEAAPNNPLFLTRICNHAYLTNKLGFERVGINRDTEDPADGTYGRHTDGELNGLIFENASRPFFNTIPKRSNSELKEALRLGVKHALSTGLTGVHTEDLRYLGNWETTWRMYRELIVEENLRLRSNLLVYYPHLGEMIEAGMTTGDGDQWVNVGALKLFADGAMGGRTALMSMPYADAPHTYGQAIHSQEEIIQIAAAGARHGMPIAVHAIGDGAADLVLEAMEQTPSTKHRHRLIHAQVLRPEQIERMKRLGDRLVLDIQPRFLVGDFPWVLERIQPALQTTSYAWKTLIDAGLLCGGGSDAPIEPIEPLLGLHAAVTRKRPHEHQESYQPEQKLTMEEAVRLFTIGGTYATQEEAVKGTLTVGKYADMTILDRNIFEEDPDVLLETSVIRTIIGGESVFEK